MDLLDCYLKVIVPIQSATISIQSQVIMGKKSKRQARKQKDVTVKTEDPNDEDPRATADLVMASFNSISKTDNQQSSKRFLAFYCYCAILSRYAKENFATAQDRAFLKKVAKDDTELCYFRAQATVHMAYMYLNDVEMVESFHCFMEGVAICDNAKDEEKAMVFTGLEGEIIDVGELLVGIREQCDGIVSGVQSKGKFVRMVPDGEDQAISWVAGVECDFCFKTREELGGTVLDCCDVCRSTFYCSRSWQRKHWKKEHREQCRKKGEFKVGDKALTTQPFGSVIFGGPVRIVAPVPDELLDELLDEGPVTDKAQHWLVSDDDGNEHSVVSSKMLRNLRPSMWNVMGKSDQEHIIKWLTAMKAAEEEDAETGTSDASDALEAAYKELYG